MEKSTDAIYFDLLQTLDKLKSGCIKEKVVRKEVEIT